MLTEAMVGAGLSEWEAEVLVDSIEEVYFSEPELTRVRAGQMRYTVRAAARGRESHSRKDGEPVHAASTRRELYQPYERGLLRLLEILDRSCCPSQSGVSATALHSRTTSRLSRPDFTMAPHHFQEIVQPKTCTASPIPATVPLWTAAAATPLWLARACHLPKRTGALEAGQTIQRQRTLSVTPTRAGTTERAGRCLRAAASLREESPQHAQNGSRPQ